MTPVVSLQFLAVAADGTALAVKPQMQVVVASLLVTVLTFGWLHHLRHVGRRLHRRLVITEDGVVEIEPIVETGHITRMGDVLHLLIHRLNGRVVGQQLHKRLDVLAIIFVGQ